jgi:hypothetical protein
VVDSTSRGEPNVYRWANELTLKFESETLMTAKIYSVQNLSNSELEIHLSQSVKQERQLLYEILETIREIDQRKLYLNKRASLFEYLTLEHNYSAGAAQRRIDSARLLNEVPEILQNIKDGSLNLSQISAFQKAVRQKEKIVREEFKITGANGVVAIGAAAKISTQQKRELLLKLENKTTRETEKTIMESLNIPPIENTRIKSQTDGSKRLEVTLSSSAWENLKRCQKLLSHNISNGNLSSVLEKVCEFYCLKKDPLLAKEKAKPNPKSNSEPIAKLDKKLEGSSMAEVQNLTAPAAVNKPLRSPVPVRVRRFIFKRDQKCQFINSTTGKICGSRYRLEIDHFQMVCQGGSNEPSNLLTICRNHNQWLAENKLGRKFMAQFKEGHSKNSN